MVAATPAVAIFVLGSMLLRPCRVLVVPLAIHLGGCVGDEFAVLRTLREPSTTMCEDLRDGIRFHRASVAVPAAGD